MAQLATYREYSVQQEDPGRKFGGKFQFESDQSGMFVRRLLSSVASRASHQCLRPSCKHCISRLLVSRGLATKVASRQEKREFDISRLSKPLQEEIEHNRRLMREEKLSLENVNSEFSKLIKDNQVAIEATAEGLVRLTIPKEAGVSYVLQFDPVEVADSVNARHSVNEELEGEEEDDAEGDALSAKHGDEEFSMDDFQDNDEGPMPFGVNIEVHRADLPEKTLILDAEVSENYGEENDDKPQNNEMGYSFYVTNVRVKKSEGGSAFTGPSYDSLDDGLRESLDQFANRNLSKFIPLIEEYSRAKEANLYQEWLEDVKQIVSIKN